MIRCKQCGKTFNQIDMKICKRTGICDECYDDGAYFSVHGIWKALNTWDYHEPTSKSHETSLVEDIWQGMSV